MTTAAEVPAGNGALPSPAEEQVPAEEVEALGRWRNPGHRQGEARRLEKWLLATRVEEPEGPQIDEEHAKDHTHPWWKVLCLTGVDYFSSLSYLPGIAALAAGAISPIATLMIVALTLGGMLPMYRRVAKESPHGQGSVAMLERLLPFWRGKLAILTLLGFVVTSWIITITLSAADATAHLAENPITGDAVSGNRVLVTVLLLAVLGGVFLAGFSEAVRVAVPLVAAYLALNAIVVVAGVTEALNGAGVIGEWGNLVASSDPQDIIFTAALAFPLLVLGLSGFETGVSMMPLVRAKGRDEAERLQDRVRNTRKLLTTAAVIMSVYLLATTTVTTWLIPAEEFEKGGEANGRALAYLAHEMLGDTFGTVYDLSSVTILWFAGASAMAGLINIVPRYLPGYGMAPEWSRAVRPVVIVYTGVCILVTWIFDADVNAQAGAYATGILVMMVSAAGAVTLVASRAGKRWGTIGFGIVAGIFTYALVTNVFKAPEGMAISAWFIATVITVSLISRVWRSTELRTQEVEFDKGAWEFLVQACYAGEAHLVAHKLTSTASTTEVGYATKKAKEVRLHTLKEELPLVFLEVELTDPSAFSKVLSVRGVQVGQHRVLRVQAPVVANALAAVLLAIRDTVDVVPHCYFDWAEGHPIKNLFRYLLLGAGDTAPLTREVIREAEGDPDRRPVVHVGG